MARKTQTGVGDLQFSTISLRKITMGTSKIRTHLDEEDLQELKESIKALGLLQPVLLMPRKEKDRYELLIGQRRLKAYKQLRAEESEEDRWKEIPAFVVSEKAGDKALALSLAENICRVDLSRTDTTDAVTELYKLYGRDVKKVAKATGMWPETIRRYIYVKEYGSQKILDLLDKDRVSLLDAKRALQAAQWRIAKAERILERMVGLTRTEKKRFAEYVKQNPRASFDDGIREAKKPRIQRRISVDLTETMRTGLEKAQKAWEMPAEEIVAQVLEEWLDEQGYLS